MFTRRQTIAEKFSQFLTHSYHWQPDKQLQNEMQKHINNHGTQTDSFWFEFFLQRYRDPQGNPRTALLAQRHLQAYLEEICFQSAKSFAVKFEILSSLPDYFQEARLAIGNIAKAWRKYNSFLGTPIAYARRKLDRFLVELFFAALQDKATSSYGSLVRTTKKAMTLALNNLEEAKRSQYLTVWAHLKDMKSDLPTVKGSTQKPTPEQLDTIAQLCQNQGLNLSVQQVEEILENCIVALECNRPGKDKSLDDILTKQGDIFADPNDVFASLEEDPEHSRILAILLGGSIGSLDSLVQHLPKTIPQQTVDKLLILSYGMSGVTQGTIGKVLGIKQFEVSRQLTRTKTYLIKELASLAQRHPQVHLDEEYIDTLGDELDSLLAWYYRRQVVSKELENGLRSHPELRAGRRILAAYFGQVEHICAKKLTRINLQPAELDKRLQKAKEKLRSTKSVVAKKLQITEEQLLESIDDLVAKCVAYLIEFFRNKFDLTEEIISRIKECLQREVEVILFNISYGSLSIN